MKRHKKSWRVATAVVLSVAMLGTLAGCGGGGGGGGSAASEGDVLSVEGGFQGQIDAWSAYYATNTDSSIQDKYGINMKMQYFDSGMPMVQTVPANQLAIMSNGSVPSLMSALRYDTPIVGISSNESRANAVLARSDDNVFKTKNENGTFGTAEDLKGKTILTTTVSTGTYTLSKYLESLGLTENDITVKNLEQAQAIAAFESGEGDYLVLWAPFLYTGYEKGWKEVANAEQVGADCLMLWVADPKLAKENPDAIANMLAMFDEGATRFNKEGKKLAPEISQFFSDWAAMNVDEENAALDIESHDIYSLEDQLEMLENGDLLKAMQGTASYFEGQGKYTAEDVQKLEDKGYCIDSSFLKKAIEVRDAKAK
ncbi:MAG: ABC transporter substrate-binding protein [Peptococcaceae bacterium]|nr:ABC transporter substrate-binding protein [Peptococcaceae bacterium]